ncbi:Cyclic di-GMP phosphodiesterase Gmr [Delftia tsuruhatensis]|uniref:putative bifunctional diguanylate cyclase/phosphodiesterase n=1 Tax=Delftia tsuruhatensis TaxID=180282 RepID=UPI001E7997AF|nr:GGDEF and EAL domain-containing protein [Delftia tsuruhatensis]CAB5694915.1 Cyclic di-GMP phosphodiesterase Gmr [Delftia tsuruhatensis]CAC9687058.1 Cyclic di-GMP phosphodiesterase Gmr [Delftia tsuruhatensis]
MLRSARSRFIWLITATYGMLSVAWIILSDKLLFALAGDSDISAISTAKGIFFVSATVFLLYFALHFVPPEIVEGRVRSHGGHRIPRWAAYLFAAALSIAALAVREPLVGHFGERSLAILFMLPVLLGALVGGLGPGLLATAASVLGMDQLAMEPLFSLYVSAAQDRVHLAIVALNGVIVSLLVESLQHSLRQSEFRRQLLDSVISGTSDAIYVKDMQGRYLLANEAAARYVGRPIEELLGKSDSDIFPEETARRIMDMDRAILHAGHTSTHEEHVETGNGQALDFLVTKGPVLNARGQQSGLFGISHDITARKTSERELAQAAIVFESSHQGIMIVSPARHISRVNPAFSRITGYTLEEVLGKTPRALSSGVHGPRFYQQMWQDIDRAGFWSGEIWNRRKSGEIYAQLLSISVARGSDGAVQHYIGVFTDISELKAHEAALDRAIYYDALTGLPGRRLLVERLDKAVLRASASSKSLAVCFIDLDGFKEINDRLGHGAGDRFLIGVAEHLKAVLHGDDTLARLGGDEFVLLLQNLESVRECPSVLERILQAASRPVTVDGTSVATSASIGVCFYPDDHATPDTLLRHADQAMCQAKLAGKNRYHLFDPEHDRRAQAHRLQTGRLRTALEQQQFQLHYQPKVELATGRLLGVEALLRWQDPGHGLKAPAEFLSFITGSELELPLGQWIIDEAIAQAAAWAAQGLDIQVSINVGAGQLLAPGFCNRLEQVLARYPDLPAQRIELEILESAALADLEQAIEVLHCCRRAGVGFALDDFGTGYSSLTYLRKLPVQVIKIDQSFIRDMLSDSDDLSIVESVIHLATTFKLQAVAEGVETREHARRLLDMGCHHAQGYGIAMPMPAGQLPGWARQWAAGNNWLAAR